MQSSTTHTARDLRDVITIGVGAYHTVIVRRDGTAWAWGRNSFGQLGDGRMGDDATSPVPVRVQRLAAVKAVTAGRTHTLALTHDGTVWAWGANDSGELGQGPVARVEGNIALPVLVPGLAGVQAMAAGGGHSVVVGQGGTVWAWGENGYHQVGPGRVGGAVAVAMRVTGLPVVVAVAAGESHSLAVARDGTVWTWGRNMEEDAAAEATVTPRQITGLTDVMAVAGGRFHSLALRRDGTVWAWGSNYFGQLGDGTDESRSAPVHVPSLTAVTAIAAGWLHSVAVRRDGTAWSWGAHELLDVDGDDDYTTIPIQVPGVRGAVAIGTGDNHAVCLTQDGTVAAWGWNNFSQLGNNQSGPGGSVLLDS